MNHDELEKIAYEELQSQHSKADFGDVDKLHKAIASAIAEAIDAHYEQVHEIYDSIEIVGPV